MVQDHIKFFPRSTPYIRLSPYTAFHRELIYAQSRLVPITPHSITECIITSNTTFQHRFICLLFFVRLLLFRSIPFLFPVILSIHQYLGHCFSKIYLNSACNTVRTFSECKQYSSATYFCFHSQFRQPIRHSNHILFVDARHVSMPSLAEFSYIICFHHYARRSFSVIVSKRYLIIPIIKLPVHNIIMLCDLFQ